MARKRKIVPRIAVLLFAVIAIIAIGVLLGFRELDLPAEREQEKSYFRIASGQTTNQIGSALQEEGFIQSSLLFEVLARLLGISEGLQAGVYELEPGLSTYEILQRIDSHRFALYKVTVPEGYQVVNIAALLAEETGLNEEEVLEVARSGDFDYSFLPREFSGRYIVEGYLYPETYLLPADACAYEVLDIMLAQFEAMYERVFYEMYADFASEQRLDIDFHQAMTIASLVETEARVDAERGRIAGVFYNRLQAGKRLRSDPTVEYAMGYKKSRLYYSDLYIESPYNTYLYPDFPPGPIANPGQSSIKAALKPEEHDYLYFVATGDGRHKFTTNYDRHLYYKHKYLD